jgi:hypothetical protein
MGARYAAARDLSEVIGTRPHRPQFLPFITYRLQFVQSQLMLNAIRLAQPEPAATLWQMPGDGTATQDFSFEDAGNGFVYIRSHVSNLYVTAAAPNSVITSRTVATAGTKWRLSPVGSSTLDRNLFVISNQDYPNHVLQASVRTTGSPVILGANAAGGGIHAGQSNAWLVTSPSLGDDQFKL